MIVIDFYWVYTTTREFLTHSTKMTRHHIALVIETHTHGSIRSGFVFAYYGKNRTKIALKCDNASLGQLSLFSTNVRILLLMKFRTSTGNLPNSRRVAGVIPSGPSQAMDSDPLKRTCELKCARLNEVRAATGSCLNV